MDFGMTCLDGFVGSESDFLSQVSDAETRQNGYGSGFLKHGRSYEAAEEDWSNLKFARTDDLSSSRTMLLQQSNPSLFGSNSVFIDGQQQQHQHQHQQQQQQMLSFSSPNSDVMSLNQNSTLPFYPQGLPTYTRNTGLGSGSLNTSLHGILTRTRGPFTPSQWLELEQQALIYKYITAKVPIPSNLLNHIRKPLNPSGSSHFAGSSRPNPYGWGSLHLGFSANTDPEPGRCRRTDGKKWRCSRDIVPDQKYCERHMNRSRHRSRKPVEGQGGYAVSATSNKRVTSIGSSSARMASSGGPSGSLAISQHQVTSLQPDVTDPSLNSNTDSILLNQENVSGELQDPQGLSMLRLDMNAKSKDAPISILKQHNRFGQSSTMNLQDIQFSVPEEHNRFGQSSTMNLQSQDSQFRVPEEHNPFEQSSRTEFGLISTDPLMNTSNGNSYIGYLNFGSSPSLYGPEPQDEEPLYHFIDDWPNNDSSTIPWPEVEETNLDQTKLSISIPVASSDFSSSTCGKLTLSPLRMGFPVDGNMNEPTQRQANWIPISWETSNGGPLGEVLNNTNNIAGDSNNSSALNLMTEGWDTSAQMESSPEGVQQKTTSPRAETNKIDDEARLGDNSVGSTHETSSSIPFI